MLLIVQSLLLMVVLAFASCKSESSNDCSLSIGTCNTGSVECGAKLACPDGRIRKLDCTPPAEQNAKSIECQCIDNGVLGKKVELEYPLGGDADKVFESACGP